MRTITYLFTKIEHSRVYVVYGTECDGRKACVEITRIQLCLERVNNEKWQEAVDVILYCGNCPDKRKIAVCLACSAFALTLPLIRETANICYFQDTHKHIQHQIQVILPFQLS
jgi:hypothetical protein